MKKQKDMRMKLKMEDDRADLYSAIVKLKASIDELNQKGRERFLRLIQKLIENLMKFTQNYLMEGLPK